MYGYNEYVPLNVGEILKRTTEEEIFSIVIQDEIILDKGANYIAPYRNDNSASCYFEKYNGKLFFIDFGSSLTVKNSDCFEIIKKCYRVNYRKALEIINNKLNLGLGDNLGKAKKIIHEHGLVEEKNVKKVLKERVITILPRPFDYKDKQFWSNYEISKQNLIEDGVISVELFKSYNRHGQPFSTRTTDICYAYTEFPNGRKKIYRPTASKEAKWFTNCNQDDIGSIKHLPKRGDLLIISKSYKDCRVIRNQGLNSIWFQNEGMIPDKKILKNLIKRFKNIIIWFDNDSTGISNSRLVSEYINNIAGKEVSKCIMIPPKLLKEGIKDPSDLLYRKGKKVLLNFLYKYNLLDTT